MEVEDPLIEEYTLVEDPLMEEGEGPPGPQGPPGPMRLIIVQTPQVTLDTTALENIFDTVGQSMMQLARAQDQTNRQLQQHTKQGQTSQHASPYRSLTTTGYLNLSEKL